MATIQRIKVVKTRDGAKVSTQGKTVRGGYFTLRTAKVSLDDKTYAEMKAAVQATITRLVEGQ